MFTSVRHLPLPRRVAVALASALAVALVAHFATVLAFFISYDFAAAAFGRINLYFAPLTAIAFVVLAVFAFVGFFTRWYLALAAGLVAAVLAAVLGTLIVVAQTGAAITGEMV